MARLDIPPGEGGDAVQIWSLQPALGAAAMRLVDAAYNKSILPVRVREAARMRIAQLNDCTVCLAFRADKVKEQGLDEDFYCAVGTPDDGELSEQERLAVEYAERFALDHTQHRRRVHRAPAGRRSPIPRSSTSRSACRPFWVWAAPCARSASPRPR